MSKMDPVRTVLANLIAESHSTDYTANGILRDFRAVKDKRKSNHDLLIVLKTISKHRANCAQVLKEISDVLEHKDPIYALMVFANNFSDGDTVYLLPEQKDSAREPPVPALWNSVSSTEMPQSTRSARSAQEMPTSTPMNTRRSDGNQTSADAFFSHQRPTPLLGTGDSNSARGDLSAIKERVLSAVTNGTSHSSSGGSVGEAAENGEGAEISQGHSGASSRIVSSSSSSSRKPESTLKADGHGGSAKKDTGGIPDEYRTHALWDFYDVDSGKPPPEISAVPFESQQRMLLEEMLYVVTGVRGNYIVPLPQDDNAVGLAKFQTQFTINPQVDKSLAEMMLDILPLASHAVGIQKVVAATQEQGQVISALNAELRELTRDFYEVLTECEDELCEDRLTMQKLVYYLRPTISIMEELFTTVAEMHVNKHTGAAALTHLFERIKRLEGDKSAQDLAINLTRKAAVPYMRMLQLWIQKGIIVDGNHEFLVDDNADHRDELPEHSSGDYWEKRYTVREDRIPSFLERFADKILRTGKYLNVVRQCGKRVMPRQQMQLQFDPCTDQHSHVINEAYYFAARMLLDVLLTENDLMGHLGSVKRYLLLNQGDFIMEFMDACEDELAKNVDDVLPMTLENLLGLTLRLSSARNDPYKDDLHCELLTYDLVTQMSKIMNHQEEYWQTHDRLDLSGLECFAFTYDVNWPVSLVLNDIAISKYQMLFRQLFYCKHVERQLCRIWKENSIAKKFSPQAAELYRSAFTLRQRMMNAIQNLEYYMMIEIIEPNWHLFIEKMKKVENVDNVLSFHQDFLDSCLKNCMLTESSNLNRAIFKLCKLCLKFCNFIQRSQRFFLDAELTSMVCDSSDESDKSESTEDGSSRQQADTSMGRSETFAQRVNRFDLEFTAILLSFLKQITDLAKHNTGERFMNLVHRINFNSFYSDQIEKLCADDAMDGLIETIKHV